MGDLTISRERRRPQGRGRLEITLDLEDYLEGDFEVEGNFKGVRDLKITLDLDLEDKYNLHVESELKGACNLEIALNLEM